MILSEPTQAWKCKYHMFSLIHGCCRLIVKYVYLGGSKHGYRPGNWKRGHEKGENKALAEEIGEQ